MVKSKVGRPRSEKARELILGAAYELLSENHGKGLTIESIAKRAGVGKPTIYRWWPSLADVVLEATLQQAAADIPLPEYKPLQKSVGNFLRVSVQAINAGGGIPLRYLMAQAQADDEFRERFRDRFVAERRAVLKSVFFQGVEHGDISPAVNLEVLVDTVFGAMWYRLLVEHAPLDESFAAELSKIVGVFCTV